MKYVLFGDVHIDYFKDVDYHHNLFKNTLYHALDYMKENDIDNIIFMGDIFDNRTSPNIKSVLFITSLLYNFLNDNPDINIHMITGNHDVYYKNTNKISTLSLFQHNKIHIISEPKEIDNMLLLPWISEDNRNDIMQKVQNSAMEYCLGHFEFTGFKQHPTDTHLSRGMSITEFKKFKKVLSGHIHYSSEQDNVIYTGSLLQLKKDDSDDPKKYWILDTENHTVEKIIHGQNLMDNILVTNDFVYGNYEGKKIFIDVSIGVTDEYLDKVVENIRLQNPISISIYNNPNKIKKEIVVDYDDYKEKSLLDFCKDYIDKLEDVNIDNDILFKKIQNYFQNNH